MKQKYLIGLLVMFAFMLSMFSVSTMVKATNTESDYPEHCSNATEEKVVGMIVNDKFNVTEIHVAKGECFTIVIQNTDPSLNHDFVIDEVGGGDHAVIDANLSGPNIDHVDFDSETPTSDYGYGANGINKFNVSAPNVDATFEYYCDVPGHKEAGMVGKLIVGAGATTSAKGTPGFESFSVLFSMFIFTTIVMIVKKNKLHR